LNVLISFMASTRTLAIGVEMKEYACTKMVLFADPRGSTTACV
jgi:hypothetical protein